MAKVMKAIKSFRKLILKSFCVYKILIKRDRHPIIRKHLWVAFQGFSLCSTVRQLRDMKTFNVFGLEHLTDSVRSVKH